MDPELTETGRIQAGLLAEFLARSQPALKNPGWRDPQNIYGFPITHIYTSLMERAVQTADRVGETLGLPVYGWIGVHEEGGIYLEDEATGELVGYPGNNRIFFQEKYPRLELPDEFSGGGWWDRPFETSELRRPRARQFLMNILDRHGNTNDGVAVVSHGGFYYQFMSSVLGLPENHPYSFLINNTAITRIDFTNEETAIVYMNRVDFLPREMIS